MKLKYFAGLTTLVLLSTACGRQYNDNDTYVVDQAYIHKYGVAVPSDFWQSSGEDGAVVSTMGDGVVITRSYAAGLLEGETTYSYPHSSQIQKKEIYEQGTLVKVVELYFDGTPKSEIVFDSPLGMKTISSWYLSGTPRSVEHFNGDLLVNGDYYNQSNQPDARVENYVGTRLVRDDYGQLLSTDTIQGGQLSLRVAYHPNGSPKEMTPYQNGVVAGSKRTFHPAGEPATIEQWVNGKQDGTTVVYQHGDKLAEVPYASGNKHGMERRYRDGQVVVQEVSWNNGALHGPSTTYVGNTSKVDWYYKGNPTTKTDYDYMSNKMPVR